MINVAHVGTTMINGAQVGTAMINATHVGTAMINLAQVGTAMINLAQVGTAMLTGTRRCRCVQVYEAHMRELMLVNGRLKMGKADFKRARARPCTAANQRCCFANAELTHRTNN
jgi:hypothetical protein